MRERSHSTYEFESQSPRVYALWEQFLANQQITSGVIFELVFLVNRLNDNSFGPMRARLYDLIIGDDRINITMTPREAHFMSDEVIKMAARIPQFQQAVTERFPRVMSSLPEETSGSTRFSLLTESILKNGKQGRLYQEARQVIDRLGRVPDENYKTFFSEKLAEFILEASESELVTITKLLREETEHHPVFSTETVLVSLLNYWGYDGNAYVTNWTKVYPNPDIGTRSGQSFAQYCDVIAFEQNVLRFFELMRIDSEMASRLHVRNNIASVGMYPLEVLKHVDQTYLSPLPGVLWIQDPDDWTGADYRESVTLQYDLLRQIEALGMRLVVIEAVELLDFKRRTHTLSNTKKGKQLHSFPVVVINSHGCQFDLPITLPRPFYESEVVNALTHAPTLYHNEQFIEQLIALFNEHLYEKLHATRILEILRKSTLRTMFTNDTQMEVIAGKLAEARANTWGKKLGHPELVEVFERMPWINDLLAPNPAIILGGCDLAAQNPVNEDDGRSIAQTIADLTHGYTIAQSGKGTLSSILLQKENGLLYTQAEYNVPNTAVQFEHRSVQYRRRR